MCLRQTSRTLLAWLALVPTALGGPSPTEQALEAASRLVIRQCRQATLGRQTYWTSQPGALRTFDRDTGALRTIYKLYSSPELHLTDATRLATDRPADWAGAPDQWVDLNAPTSLDGDVRYPIADPRADAEGFSFEPSAAGPNPLPMPVAWLYLTRDGTLGSLNAERQFVPLANPLTGQPVPASLNNPLVARVAWWTDDATCKVNLNTASEGVFWDTPRCDTDEERAYGRFQPARGEWQRDMGHPAAVCLSSVLFPGHRLHLPGTTSALNPLTLDSARLVWQNAPGIPDAGSLGGTRSVNPDRSGAVEEPVSAVHESPLAYAAAAALPPDARTRATRGGFFLTSHNRAPDSTRDGRPRLSLWPLKSPDWQVAVNDPARVPGSTLTEFDALMARVTALRSNHGTTIRPMTVVRADPTHRSSETHALEDGQNARHASILTQTASRLRLGPKSFESKYSGSWVFSDLYALAAASVSSIRDVNSNDPWSPSPFLNLGADFPGAGQVTPLSFNPNDPGQIWSLGTRPFPRGMGRFPTVSEVALLICLRHRTRAGQTPSGFYGDNQAAAAALGASYDHYEIEVGLLIEGFVPTQGGGFSPQVSFALGGYSWPWEMSQSNGQEFNVGLMSLNGRPLVFPVNDAARSTATALPRDATPPARWNGNAGSLGVRFARDLIAFKPLLFSQEPGTPAPRLQFSGSPAGASQHHLRLIMSDAASLPPSNKPVDTGNLVQLIPLAFPEIRAGAPLPFNDPTPVPLRGGTSHRLARAQASGLILGTEGVIHDGDIVQSLLPNHGDFRLSAAKEQVMQGLAVNGGNNDARRWPTFVAHPNYGRTAQAHSLTEPDQQLNASLRMASAYAGDMAHDQLDAGYFDALAPAALGLPSTMTAPGLAYRPDYTIKAWSDTPVPLMGALSTGSIALGALSGGTRTLLPAREVFTITRYDRTGSDVATGPFRRGEARPDLTGDFDNGIAQALDGPYINATDPGDARAWAGGGTPYFDDVHAPWVPNPGTYSPYRQMPSAMMLGSLPTGVQSNVPWQTLLFRPDPGRGTASAHFGSSTPADHLFADFFRMPVVKPSELVDWNDPDAAWKPSDAFSTEGRINMNCEIVPFSHIRRTTALHALLKAQKILAIPDEAGAVYKSGAGTQKWRHHIDATETLRQWTATFAAGDVFRTATEIAEQWLVPEGATVEQMPAFWARHRLTGDNSKERPYANIYPHLTTRSLTFDLHVVAETIDKATSTPPNVFVPGTDRLRDRSQRTLKITGRLDPKTTSLPDYAGLGDGTDPEPLDAFVHWSTPDLDPAPSVEPKWISVTTENGSLRLSWRAAPDQACRLEVSSDLSTWSPLDTYRTGTWRDTVTSQTGLSPDPRLATVILPLGSASGAQQTWVRLRWSPD